MSSPRHARIAPRPAGGLALGAVAVPVPSEGVDLFAAFAEPAALASGWAAQPPVAALCLLGLAGLLLAFSQDRAPGAEPVG